MSLLTYFTIKPSPVVRRTSSRGVSGGELLFVKAHTVKPISPSNKPPGRSRVRPHATTTESVRRCPRGGHFAAALILIKRRVN